MTEYSAEAQAAWGTQVRNELVQLGFDPDEVEADNEGFGQDFMEYSNDAAGFARLLVQDDLDTKTAVAAVLAAREADTDGHTPDWMHVDEAVADLDRFYDPTSSEYDELVERIESALAAHDAQS